MNNLPNQNLDPVEDEIEWSLLEDEELSDFDDFEASAPNTYGVTEETLDDPNFWINL